MLMDWANLAIALAAMITGVVATYFTYVTVQDQLRRRRRARTGPPDADSATAPELAGSYDVFVSYAGADEAQAVRLGARLRDHGLRVFLARWIGLGLVEDLEKERALLSSANGVLVFSRATMSDSGIRDEYAALLQRVHSGGRRFIPVLIESVELPPFARIRVPLDLTRDGAAYDAQIDALARALRASGLGTGP